MTGGLALIGYSIYIQVDTLIPAANNRWQHNAIPIDPLISDGNYFF